MKPWPKHPVIYEINTWVWLRELTQKYQRPVDLATVAIPIPEPCFIAVGEKDERIEAVLPAEGVGVIRGLAFAHERVPAGRLGFDNRKDAIEPVDKTVVGEFTDGILTSVGLG